MSSCFTSLLHSCNFFEPPTSRPLFQPQSPAYQDLHATAQSTSLCRDSSCEVVPCCTALVASSNSSLAHSFFNAYHSHILLTQPSAPESGRLFASRELWFDHGLPSGIGHLRFVSFGQPEVVAVSTEVDRVRLAVVWFL